MNEINVRAESLTKVKNWQKRKAKTDKLAKELINTSTKTKKINKHLLRVFTCSEVFTVYDNEISTWHCKSKYCTNCSNLKTSKLLQKHLPELKTWDNPHFLTLTRQTLTKREIKKFVGSKLQVFWSRINNSYYRQKNKESFKYIRALKFVLKPDVDGIHLYFHIITFDLDLANYIKKQWVKFNRQQGTARRRKVVIDEHAQDIRPLTENGATELIKYILKPVHFKDSTPKALELLKYCMELFHNKKQYQSIGYKTQQTNESKEKPKMYAPNGIYNWNWWNNEYYNRKGALTGAIRNFKFKIETIEL